MKNKITGQLKLNDFPEFNILAHDWLDFAIQINKFMAEMNIIEFPLGEDDDMEIVQKKTKDCEKFR